MASGFGTVLKKYERAQKHINDLETGIDAFRDANKNLVGVKQDDQTGDKIYFVLEVPSVPLDIPLVLGDALHNLRSTLDHLAHAIAKPVGRQVRDTKFPIFDTAADFGALAPGCVKGVRKPCFDKIAHLQPYKNGNGHRLWQLHNLDIIDKHRVLPTTVFAPVGRTTTPSERKALDPIIARLNRFGTLKNLSLPHRVVGSASAPTIPLQVGQELLRVPASEANQNVSFSFDVALHESGVAEATPLLYFLGFVNRDVWQIVNELGPCF